MCRSEPHSCFPNFMRGSMNLIPAKRELIHISERKDGNPFAERIGNTKGLEVLKKKQSPASKAHPGTANIATKNVIRE